MKTKTDLLVLGMVLAMPFGVSGALDVPGADDSDGALHVTEDTVIDLRLATAGDGTTVKWDTDNAGNAGNGVYDPKKWAVVFKYSSVLVDAGVTLSFTNHGSRAPVVWLVSGGVTIDGTVSLNGANGVPAPLLAEPGPGGFRGGMGYYRPGVDASPGFGPGGANFRSDQGYGGSFGTQGGAGPVPYGNPSLIPLIGGAGGGGDGDEVSGGGSGGGALLIACQNTLTVNGTLRANGGNRAADNAGGGSGGALRLVAETMAGSGGVQANGGKGWNYHGGLGRLRLERAFNSSDYTITPDPSVVTSAEGATVLLWPPDTAPSVTVVSIGGETAPDDPRAGFGSLTPDVALAATDTIEVVVETTNVEEASQVQVRVTPRTNNPFTVVDATVQSTVSEDPLVIRWAADVPVGTGYSGLQVKVVRP